MGPPEYRTSDLNHSVTFSHYSDHKHNIRLTVKYRHKWSECCMRWRWRQYEDASTLGALPSLPPSLFLCAYPVAWVEQGPMFLAFKRSQATKWFNLCLTLVWVESKLLFTQRTKQQSLVNGTISLIWLRSLILMTILNGRYVLNSRLYCLSPFARKFHWSICYQWKLDHRFFNLFLSCLLRFLPLLTFMLYIH